MDSNSTGSGSNDEIQKILNDYARLKSQFMILRNAYQEEQRLSSSYYEELKKKEIELSTTVKQLETLNLTNQSLSKAFCSLQEELIQPSLRNQESTKSEKNKKPKDANYSIEDFDVLKEELRCKDKENASLRVDIELQRSALNKQINEFEQQMLQVNAENDEKVFLIKQELDEENKRNTKLIKEKSALEARLIQFFADIQECKSQVYKQAILNSYKCDENEQLFLLKQKLIDAIDKMHLAESKAFSFEEECKALQNRLKYAEEEIETCYESKQELKTSVKNYEMQLKMLTEHVAALNDKLISKGDEIEQLKHSKEKNEIKSFFF